MSGHGAPDTGLEAHDGRRPDGRAREVALVAATWHAEIMGGLIDGALAAAEDAGASVRLVRVPGTFELGVVAARLAQQVDAVVALGAVIRGDTPHFDHICASATQALTHVAVSTGTPVGFGVLTCDTEDQARDRAGLPGSRESAGYAAAAAALRTARVLAEQTPVGSGAVPRP